jgi:hypothetical protein
VNIRSRNIARKHGQRLQPRSSPNPEAPRRGRDPQSRRSPKSFSSCAGIDLRSQHGRLVSARVSASFRKGVLGSCNRAAMVKRRAGLTGSCCRGAGHEEGRKRVRKGFQGRNSLSPLFAFFVWPAVLHSAPRGFCGWTYTYSLAGRLGAASSGVGRSPAAGLHGCVRCLCTGLLR